MSIAIVEACFPAQFAVHSCPDYRIRYLFDRIDLCLLIHDLDWEIAFC